ncbi:tRNA (adenosine(37)-N6)-threonylcarbamoyltransferase complex transferase subunit TsaD [Campylobacter sp. RM9344]|uniref:tRNA N6-adenosine threonylcarbamoyltransferase n=1 Tax=Campylobacter californiensis TaxID=1032243 RepID=A0AAW3ZXR8_9BACT|nr:MULTISPECIES: tRNA (adenosine(37)-N6)-threonylcarbamoyltransferase complex transferase subunit TsaD [unclassified Campylobacter]MBE2984045.1 tRNA (adenosine(37)-N6)-threonylcarbamoyltransferase complex transferase subunit TsaD [Campylobacter sp. RM6883]MBE2987090.1 tRNA (adenosine(37)-N6)-threonylcarbamoyltransferase complex transferase subunit TsaD [Campylobacter sp. RM12919]MBE2988366.1 tRNA (adenosine(37)-N6)-threonylcarbamoyltransferase complex transferase subunit TsaD [Campylobacter sp. 
MILGIESSCDDSSVALLDIKNLELIYHKKISQEMEHSLYGGVVPELAARLHTKALPMLLEEIKPKFKEIKAIAVTNEPGLSVSLIGGVSMAKALSIALKVPLMAVNHLIGHIYSLFLNEEAKFPLGVLLVSGGHTMVLDIDESAKINLLLSTGDDSFGESFDKVAKMLGLGYPGGAVVQELALRSQNKVRFKFTVPLLHDKRLEYSFSGLKNQVRVEISKLANLNEDDMADICYAFENTACLHIMDKLTKVFEAHKFKRFGIVGGASANLNLRSRIEKLCQKHECELLLAPLKFCSDNAAMIARVGREKYLRGEFVKHNELMIKPRSEIDRA